MSSLVRVLEVGGTHVTAATVDVLEQRVRERTRTMLDSAAPAASILAALQGAAMTLADTIATRWAVAMPDPFDYARGVALFRDVGKFDALYGIDVGRALIDAIIPRPHSITFAHDTEALLLGEWTCGAARGARRCAAITLGTGVGSAFLDGGTVVRTGHGLPPDGRIHRVHIDGAPLEDSVSRRAIRARYAAGSDRADRPDVREIAERARAGDAHAASVLSAAFRTLGRAAASAVREFAPDVLVVGGSVARSWDLLIGPFVSGLAEGGVRQMDIRPAQNEADSAVIGAARHVVVPASARIGTQSAATREIVLRALAGPHVIERLAAYYAHDSNACGTNFLDGTETQSLTALTSADLFAVTALGFTIAPPVVRNLLRDTAAFADIARCLAPDRLPVDVPLDEASPAVVDAMSELHVAIVAATGDAELATALCARKRPELFPVLDQHTRDALRLPAGSVQSCWRSLRGLLRDQRVRGELDRVFVAVRRLGVSIDVYPLRQVHALVDSSAASY